MSDPSVSPNLRGHPAFVQYWIARITSGFGYEMLSVAVGWQIYAMTHRALDLGLIGLAQFLPSLLFALPAGHVADQFDRRRVVVACQLVAFAAMSALALGSAFGGLDETRILALVFVLGSAYALGGPSRVSMVPALVPTSLLPAAISATASAQQVAMIAGPALGGLVYAFGPTAVHATAAVLQLAAVAAMARLRYEHAPPPREPATLRTVFAGVTFIRARPVLLGVISLDLFAVLLGGATALLPIFAQDVLHTGPWGLGLLRAAPAIGAIAMSVWLARHVLERRTGPIMFASVAGFGVATVLFALSTNLWLSVAALATLGAFDMVSMVIRGALVQLETPDAMRGRVNAVNAIFINTSNQLGEFESGLVAAWLGAVPAALVGGLGTLVVVATWMALFPALRRRDRLRDGAPA